MNADERRCDPHPKKAFFSDSQLPQTLFAHHTTNNERDAEAMPCFSSTALLTLLFALPSVAQPRSLLFSHIFSGAHSSRSLLLPRPVPSSLASPSFPPVLRGGKHSVAMITVSEDQVRWYRQKKSFLANEPAPSMEAAASAAIGIQCQVIPHGLMQLWNRLGQRGSSKDSQSTAKSSKRQRKKSSQAEVSCTSTLTMASMATEIFEQYRSHPSRTNPFLLCYALVMQGSALTDATRPPGWYTSEGIAGRFTCTTRKQVCKRCRPLFHLLMLTSVESVLTSVESMTQTGH